MLTEGLTVRWAALLIIAIISAACAAPQASTRVQAGDIVFHTSQSPQSQAIQLATHSPYSHMGMVLFRSGQPFVLEAAGKVQLTPLAEWSARGTDGRYVVKRLRNPGALAAADGLTRLEHTAMAFLGRPYDPYFEWSDDRIYCSELVWKAYDRGLGIQLGDLSQLSTFDLSSPVVQKKLAERYGSTVPMSELVISPAAMFASPLLQPTR